MQRYLALIVLTGLLGACQTTKRSAEAAIDAPLETLNLKREEIPDYLNGLRNAYAYEGRLTCKRIAAEVAIMDKFLGRDRDFIAEKKDKTLTDRASDRTVGAVENAADGLIPYSNIVRYLTGASAHDKKVKRAYEVGLIRRGYMKGRGEAMKCPPPAAPLEPHPETIRDKDEPEAWRKYVPKTPKMPKVKLPGTNLN